jgi:hypothetical protein
VDEPRVVSARACRVHHALAELGGARRMASVVEDVRHRPPMQPARRQAEAMLEGEGALGHRERRSQVAAHEPAVAGSGQHQRGERVLVHTVGCERRLCPREQLVAHAAERQLAHARHQP